MADNNLEFNNNSVGRTNGKPSTSHKAGGFLNKNLRNILLLMLVILLAFYCFNSASLAERSKIHFFTSCVEVDTDGDGVLEVYEKEGLFDKTLSFLNGIGSSVRSVLNGKYTKEIALNADGYANGYSFEALSDNGLYLIAEFKCTNNKCASSRNDKDIVVLHHSYGWKIVYSSCPDVYRFDTDFLGLIWNIYDINNNVLCRFFATSNLGNFVSVNDVKSAILNYLK